MTTAEQLGSDHQTASDLDAWVDLRSDFVARPTAAMIDAMVSAAGQAGGFGLREDAIVSRLEKSAADIVGKEDALFVPTCTMANQIALHIHCRPGEAFFTESSAHVVTSEAGAAAALTGTMPKIIAADKGALDLDELRDATGHSDAQRSRPAVVVQENTHVRSGGRVVPVAHMSAVHAIAGRQRVPVHFDGARIFNAAIALDVPIRRLAENCETVSFNLNKGLGAPLGAILAGSRATITEAVRVRQMFGGGWRPAGILAAAGLVALETMVDRLHEDHARALELADGLASLPAINVDRAQVETNIVLARPTTMHPGTLAAALEIKRVRVLPFGDAVRLVTHHEISDSSVAFTLNAIESVLNGARDDT